MDKLTSAPGSYILVLQLDVNCTIQVGRLGQFSLQPGYYLYVGSALGPGGVAARVAHHQRTSQRSHWHIDYLRKHTSLIHVHVSYGPDRREHEWAQWLARHTEIRAPIAGFGASDCSCNTHLFFSPSLPQIDQLLDLL